jgi:cytochrome b involved in lipid metabolism
VAYDITDFADRHPGGRWLINLAIGRDATGAARGRVRRMAARHSVRGMLARARGAAAG